MKEINLLKDFRTVFEILPSGEGHHLEQWLGSQQ